MKNLLVAILLFALLPAAALAQGPLDDINAEAADWLPRVALYQNQFAGLNGRYQQMLWSHTAAPSVSTAPDNLSAHPDDEPATGGELWLGATLPATTTYRIRVDVYTGPSGVGYVVVLETTQAGDSWLRMANYGPESWRDTDWFKVDEF